MGYKSTKVIGQGGRYNKSKHYKLYKAKKGYRVWKRGREKNGTGSTRASKRPHHASQDIHFTDILYIYIYIYYIYIYIYIYI